MSKEACRVAPGQYGCSWEQCTAADAANRWPAAAHNGGLGSARYSRLAATVVQQTLCQRESWPLAAQCDGVDL